MIRMAALDDGGIDPAVVLDRVCDELRARQGWSDDAVERLGQQWRHARPDRAVYVHAVASVIARAASPREVRAWLPLLTPTDSARSLLTPRVTAWQRANPTAGQNSDSVLALVEAYTSAAAGDVALAQAAFGAGMGDAELAEQVCRGTLDRKAVLTLAALSVPLA